MINWDINTVESYLGISGTSIRYYEKMGIISPKRKKNGYRLFSSEDIINLVDCKRYTAYGFTLKNVVEMFSNLDQESFPAQMKTHLRSKQRKNDIQTCTNNNLSELVDTIELMPLRGDDLYIKKIPKRYFLPLLLPDQMDLNTLLPEGKEYLHALVHMFRFFTLPIVDDSNLTDGGYFISEESFQLFNHEEQKLFTAFPEHFAFCRSIQIKNLNELYLIITDCVKKVEAKGYQTTQTVYVDSLFRICVEGVSLRYMEIEIPVTGVSPYL